MLLLMQVIENIMVMKGNWVTQFMLLKIIVNKDNLDFKKFNIVII